MTQRTLTGLLVGMHFRPPAKLILESLPAGAPLRLEAEPSNAYDEHAVKVLVSPTAVPRGQYERLEAECPSMGHEWEEICAQYDAEGILVHLGYIAAKKNKALKDRPDLVSNEVFVQAQSMIPWASCSVRLGFGPAGEPLVILQAPEDQGHKL